MAAISEQLKTGITALAGGATPSAVANTLVPGVNVISVCATAGDSVILPALCAAGTTVVVRNDGAARADVFPPTGGTINGGTATTGDFAVTNAKGGVFWCADSTGAGLTWVSILSA